VCQYFNNSLNELRSDLIHLNSDVHKELSRMSEAQGDLVKKEEFNIRMKSAWDGLKAVQSDLGTVAVLKDRSAIVEQRLKVEEEECKELAREMQRLRELKARDDERKELLRELQELRERLAVVEGRQGSGPAVKSAVHRQ
jgi:hypothetical protein